MKKVVACVAVAFAAVGSAVATPVSGETAMKAVDTWLGRRVQLEARMGARAASVWSCQTNGASFHVVKVADGGFVVTSADTEIEPIVAFSESEDLVVSEENPLWVMLTKDLSSRQRQAVKLASAAKSANAVAIRRPADKWAALTGGTALLTGGERKSSQAASGLSSLSDVRVAPLVESRWNQAQDSIYSNRGSPCYNYYTPNNFPCGCVATAGAQIMRYHRFPTSSVAPVSRNCQVMTGKDWIDDVYYYPVYADAVYTTQGGVYAWDDMPLVPANGTTETQRKAIGKLTSDIGISCGIAYGESFSAAASYMLAPAFTGVFGYANALPVQYPGSCDAAVWKAAILPNLDAKLPVEVSLNGSLGGHAVLADGYGYSLSTLYVHFNMGWAGEGDAWYAPPAVEEFTSVDGFVCNVYPSGAANGVICSGRVLTAEGKPVAGADVAAQGSSGARTSCRTDAKGIYALILAAGTHTLNATKGGETSTVMVSLLANVGIRITESGSYYTSPSPVVSNVFGQDIRLSADTEPSQDVDPQPYDPQPGDPEPSACIAETYGPFDPGVKMSLVIPELIGYTAKGLPSGLKLDKKTGTISGAPKKADLTAEVTFTKSGAETLMTKIVIGSWPQVAFACPELEAASFAVGVLGTGEGIPLEIDPLSAVKSVKASKLPSGMKLAKDKKTGLWTITGAPKKAGDYEVVFTLTTTYGSQQTLTVPLRVEALADWATGTFGGMVGRTICVGEDDEWRPYGMVDMKVTAAGKITAKVAAGGKTCSFTANGFESVEERGGYRFYRFVLKTKAGDVYEGEIAETSHDVKTMLSGDVHGDPEGLFMPVGREPYRAVVWRNEHGKDGRLSTDPSGRAARTIEAIKALKTVSLADYDPAYGTAVLTIGKDGATKLSDTTADGVKLGGKGFLKLDNASCHVIADMAVFDKKSGNVYAVTPCWQPLFDASGEIVGWDEKCCDHALRVYPFE